MSELALIERITERIAIRPGTTLGIGDDAALVQVGGEVVATHDMLVEGVHFTLGAGPLRDLGAKSLAVNVSDLAAMGAVPVAALVGLGVPAGMGADEVGELYAGMEEVAADQAMTVAGGDVTSAPVLVLGVTALGRPVEGVAPVRRSGARAGDLLCVTGPLGAAAAALLAADRAGPGLRAALHRPVPRVAEGQTLARGGVTAMLDISDGLALDARRLAEASGLRARIRLRDVPLADGVAAIARAAGRAPAVLAATGGEDYELLAAVPPACRAALSDALGGRLWTVGELAAGPPGVDLLDDDGHPVHVDRLGWEHRG